MKFIFKLILPVFFLLNLLSVANAQIINTQTNFNPLAPTQKEKIKEVTNPFAFAIFNPNTTSSSIYQIVAQILMAFFSLLAIIFLILIVMAGYKWMTAQGSPAKVKEAQDSIRTAIIGLVLMVSAFAITSFVFAYLPDNTIDVLQ